MTLPAPKHYWKFDETSGTTAADASGGAVIALDRASWVPGRQGNAIRFNPNDGVKLATTSLPELPPPWTAGFWVKREADTEGSTLFSSTAYALKLEQWQNTHKVGFTKYATSSTPGTDMELSYTAPAGQWVHLALVGTATEVVLYVNGVRQDSIHEAVNLGLKWLGSSKGYVEHASAVLDEIKIFDQALTDAQIAEMAQEVDAASKKAAEEAAAASRKAAEKAACESVISELRRYQSNNWAIGLNGDTLQPDGFISFFSARNLPFKYYVRSKGTSMGDPSAYNENINTLNAYIARL